MSLIAMRNAMTAGGVEHFYRYVRLKVGAMRDDGYDSTWGNIIQISRIELVDGDGDCFPWPNDTVCSASPYVNFASGEGQSKVLDHSVRTKMCGRRLTLPTAFVFDVRDAIIDVSRFVRWQWWAANDSVDYPYRNPSDFSLELSADNEKWVTVDSVAGFNGAIQNYALAYEGAINLAGAM